MRALRNSKTWLFLTLHALLILVGAPAFASQCCCASESFAIVASQIQKTDASCHDVAPAKAEPVQAIVMNCCAPEVARQTQTSPAQNRAHNQQSESLQSVHLTRMCSCDASENVAVASDELRATHHISYLVAILPATSAPRFQAAPFSFAHVAFSVPPAPTISRAAGRSPPLV